MELFRKPNGVESRNAMAENPTARKGGGGIANNGAKGHICENIEPGASRTLLEVSGSGIITRIFVTFLKRTPLLLRSLRFDIFWDGAKTPAVSVPLGDFFCACLGQPIAFESELFSNPEGRSFNCYIPMPFRKSAKITVTNESDNECTYFVFDISLVLGVMHDDDTLFFHSHWRREAVTTLEKDFDVLPEVTGSGRFLGCNCGVIGNSAYEGLWFGEGQFKGWIDDDKFPTICGTGTEDYIGAAWEMDLFSHQKQGCLIKDSENDLWAFYRWHTVDPIFFDKNFRASFQILGGGPLKKVLEVMKNGAPSKPVYLDDNGRIMKLLEDPSIDIWEFSDREDMGCVFFRQDDWCATSYFYLDRPENGLPELQEVQERLI